MIADISRGSGVSEDTARRRIMDMLGGIPMGQADHVARWLEQFQNSSRN